MIARYGLTGTYKGKGRMPEPALFITYFTLLYGPPLLAAERLLLQAGTGMLCLVCAGS